MMLEYKEYKMSDPYYHSYAYCQWRRDKTGFDPRSERKESAQEGTLLTIIEYSTEKKPWSSYPHKIISPLVQATVASPI